MHKLLTVSWVFLLYDFVCRGALGFRLSSRARAQIAHKTRVYGVRLERLMDGMYSNSLVPCMQLSLTSVCCNTVYLAVWHIYYLPNFLVMHEIVKLYQRKNSSGIVVLLSTVLAA